MINSRNLTWVIPLLLFVSFPLWRPPVADFLSPRGGYDESLANRKLDAHNFKMEQVHITQSENGATTLVIQARQAHTGTTQDEFELEDVDATITSNTGEETIVVARKGILNKKQALLTLIDDVVLTQLKNNYTLRTDHLIFNDTTNIVNSLGKTRVTGEKIDITGNNLIFNTKTESYDLGGRVRCILSNFSDPDSSAP